MLQESKEVDFVEHTLQPRMEALGVKSGQVRSELVRLDPMDSDDDKDVAAALCKRGVDAIFISADVEINCVAMSLIWD